MGGGAWVQLPSLIGLFLLFFPPPPPHGPVTRMRSWVQPGGKESTMAYLYLLKITDVQKQA
jgi:hypothetical protein